VTSIPDPIGQCYNRPSQRAEAFKIGVNCSTLCCLVSNEQAGRLEAWSHRKPCGENGVKGKDEMARRLALSLSILRRLLPGFVLVCSFPVVLCRVGGLLFTSSHLVEVASDARNVARPCRPCPMYIYSLWKSEHCHIPSRNTSDILLF
jgi:hypothetical protein